MRIENELKLNFDDVLIRPKRSTLKSRNDVSLIRTFTFLHSPDSWQGIPIIASNMDTVGTMDASKVMADNLMITWLHKYIEGAEWKTLLDVNTFTMERRDYVAPTVGEGEYFDWGAVHDPKLFRVDVANGYRECFVDWIKRFRDTYPQSIIFAGNVVTPEQTEELLLNGADVVVIGIGSGGQCTTRIKAGVGYPQLSAIIECADAAHGLGGHICSDGGCRNPGDIVKAFAAGADFVALGSMLAAHEENTSRQNMVWVDKGDREDPTHARVYGMSSERAMNNYHGGVAKHRTSEGRETLIPYRGKLQNTLDDIMGGLRSGCTYVGAKKLKEISKRTTFVRTNQVLNSHWSE